MNKVSKTDEFFGRASMAANIIVGGLAVFIFAIAISVIVFSH